jgi:hypothetical protein
MAVIKGWRFAHPPGWTDLAFLSVTSDSVRNHPDALRTHAAGEPSSSDC